ncbi:MAG: MBL fold metallo-hydrolase [Oscillospiraceae bacterium]|jgi:phosphoribosyl 1,2-cyclic phosphodiesterase|nr:MBL fold metallo-hydrolase [Oscillospiraceae bacterium]
MGLICTLASGSSGNAVLIGYKSTYLLVDAGISAKRIKNALWELGISELSCVLVTHEHGDHTSGLAVLRKDVYAAPYTAQAIRREAPALNIREITGEFNAGDIGVTPFATPHDTPDSLGYLLHLGGFRVCVCTDLGHVTKAVLDHASQADCLLIESNHDETMLRNGSYPAFIKKRILGPNGHLSNDASAEVTLAAARGGARYVTLCHLSKDNNHPGIAKETASRRLLENGIGVGRDVSLTVAPRSAMGVPIRV